MGNTMVILLGYVLNFILIIVIISLLLRIRNIERKLINFTPTEAYAIMESMREMTTESESIADTLERSIKERESVLEDLSDLVDEKIARLDKILSKDSDERDIKSKIISLFKHGKSEADIARELGISVTEVRLAVSLLPKG
ncbi:MAG: hypothetical protein K2N67_05995 [Mucispirillum sp.]|nr:hypothetical protein [Mucispirillum sp.]